MLSLKSERFISDKLLMIEGKGCMFVKCILYPSTWVDQRGPLGDKENITGDIKNITQWFWCQTVNTPQNHILIAITNTRCEVAMV